MVSRDAVDDALFICPTRLTSTNNPYSVYSNPYTSSHQQFIAMPSDSRKRKSIDNFLDDSPEPVLKKRNKANSSDRLNVEKPAMMEDEQGHPYWEVQLRSHISQNISKYLHVCAVVVQQTPLGPLRI